MDEDRVLRSGGWVARVGGSRVLFEDDEGGRRRTWRTDGAAIPEAASAARGIFLVPTARGRLHLMEPERGARRSARLRWRAERTWLRREAVLALGRDRAALLRLEDLLPVLEVAARGRFDPGRCRVSWPAAALVAHREAHALNLPRGEALRLPVDSEVGAVAIWTGRVLVVERERVHHLDGRALRRGPSIDAGQRLRPETLRVARGRGIVVGRDVAVLADLAAPSLASVRAPGRIRAGLLRGDGFLLRTRDLEIVLAADGRETGRGPR